MVTVETRPSTDRRPDRPPGDREVLCPFTVRVEPIARFLNCEIPDDPHYDGLELQAFDDPVHGTGMLAFLSRRNDRRIDYYVEPGLRLDRSGYALGAGTGRWVETRFEAARLDVTADGVVADVRFPDRDGRPIEVRVDDRDGRRRRRGRLLAPVGAGIDEPASLLLVSMGAFDLVRAGGDAPVIAIDGRPASTGRLPGARLHKRHLVKYAAGLCAVVLNERHDGPIGEVVPSPAGALELDPTAEGITAISAGQGGHRATLRFLPAFPDLPAMPENALRGGSWAIDIDGVPAITGGTWAARRHGDRVDLELDVTRRWRPTDLPLLMRLVTTLIPTFRRWPTTYRWSATLTLGRCPALTSRWERKAGRRDDSYRRMTRSTG